MKTIYELGSAGELAVCEYLKKLGYKIILINFRTRLGEIDIIATKQEFLVCVEVKTRRKKSAAHGFSVTKTKQRRIVAATKMFCAKYQVSDMVIRFDVALVIFTNKTPHINYIRNAFYADS